MGALVIMRQVLKRRNGFRNGFRRGSPRAYTGLALANIVAARVAVRAPRSPVSPVTMR